MLSPLTTHEVACIYQLITNTQASFHLRWKENLRKHHTTKLVVDNASDKNGTKPINVE